MPNYFNSYPQQYQQYYPQNYQPMIPQQASQPQIQNGGFVSVRNETEARNYPIAPGTSITFKDETAPFIYTKTMGFSQLDRPIFDKYRLEKEATDEQEQSQPNNVIANLQAEIQKLWGEINDLKHSGYATEISTREREKDGES